MDFHAPATPACHWDCLSRIMVSLFVTCNHCILDRQYVTTTQEAPYLLPCPTKSFLLQAGILSRLCPRAGATSRGACAWSGRARLQALQAAFHAQVGQQHAWSRQASQKRHSATVRRQAMNRLSTYSGSTAAQRRRVAHAVGAKSE